MYSRLLASVNAVRKAVRGSGVVISLCVLSGAVSLSSETDPRPPDRADSRPLFCDETLRVLFTPRHPQLGRYEVCTTMARLAVVAHPEWKVEALQPLDAFGAAGSYDRSALSRLYGGRRPSVARGWTRQDGRFESLTLISPYPDATLTRLMPGTLVIRYIVGPSVGR